MREVVITIYASRSILGQEFIGKFESMVIPFMANELNLKVILNGLYADVAFGDMVKSGLGSDLVIFDASIEEGFHDNYKVANMLPMTLSHFLVISREQTDFAIKKGEWVCQICGHKYYVIEDLRSQYRWWPMRMAKSTGPNGVFLEKIPVYSLSNTLTKN